MKMCEQIFKKNIAGRLPENSRNSFVDLESQKHIKKDRPKKFAYYLHSSDARAIFFT